ncbi:MAG: hypothetical protein K9L70_02225 [Thiohalocapsa sp.]|nr:hypothetical protein [Thiohalocapsa sp.]MCF7990430.1 hypothetical protein [Thiohalocapsa sp.]
MNKRNAVTNSLAAAGAVAMLLAIQGNAVGAECKGKEKSSCDTTTSCTWVDSYQRKDGVKVDGYCRNKGGKKTGSTSG